MAKRTRKSYTEAQRQNILQTAQGEGLTAAQVQKRFGVRPVTYYSWRKKQGLKGPRGRRPAAAAGGAIGVQLRASVQSRVRQMLPAIVREEVSGYLDSLFGDGPRRRGRPRKQA
ncbi:MAG TPA: transposase [Candidatus Acidoferrales bacterium]|nr:transposase [Candidatus Acidoferrales bacterium]